MSNEMGKTMQPRDQIVKTYITQINFETLLQSDKEQLASVKVHFFHNNGYWKGGWLIEGFILEPIYPGEEI